ncbi:MAG: sulfite exporter TauE/SafE family protein [Gemmatimonadota bacterium]|nr:sulfite exporter TauE/SafE family protein [Gemmatimonadota bacterium]
MSPLLGFGLALLIGVALGMLGGGGSILTVPVFVYVMGFEPKDAIAMSLPVVGATSLVGAIGHWREGNVDRRAVVIFAPLAMVGAMAGARLATLVSGTFQLVLLGVAMVAAGVLMLRDRGPAEGAPPRPAGRSRVVALAASGLAVGVLTGLVGVGGGFLIVPALVLLASVPIRRAIGTSLLVISLSTLTALAAYQGQATISWPVVAAFTALAIVGAVVGTRAGRRAPARGLRRAFGVVVLALAAFLLYENRAAGARDGTPGARRTR